MSRQTPKDEALEAIARVIFGLGPNEPISRQKINRKRIQLALAWNPSRVPQKMSLYSEVLVMVDRCYYNLLPKAQNLPEPEVGFVGNLIKRPVGFSVFKTAVAITLGLILILVL